MVQLIATIIFLGSVLGMVFILYKKIPDLVQLSQNGNTGIFKNSIVYNIKNKVENIYTIFKKQIILHKFLSWVKVMTLKAEIKIDTLLHRIRKKAQQIDKETNGKNGKNLLL